MGACLGKVFPGNFCARVCACFATLQSILSQILAHYIATTSNQRHRAVVHIAFFTYFMQGVRNMLLYLLAKDDITHHRDFRDLLN